MSTPFQQLLINTKFPRTNLFNQTYLPKTLASAKNTAKVIQSLKHDQNNISCPSSRYEAVSTAISGFELGDHLLKKVDSVNKALEEAMVTMAKTEPMKLYESMRYSICDTGGKRIRPILCLAACELVGGHESSAMPGACAIEIIHLISLLIDDLPCADNHDLRRGKPTNHKMFGETTAIHAMTCLVALAFEHLASASDMYNNKNNYNFNNYKIIRAISELGRATGVHGVVAGQMADYLYTENGISDVDLETLDFISRRKAGIMIEVSVVIGAILGGGSEEEVALLRKFGKCVGDMFQLKDDLLDMEGDALLDKQATYPKLLGVERSKEIVLELRNEAEKLILSGFDPKKAAPLIELANYNAFRSM